MSGPSKNTGATVGEVAAALEPSRPADTWEAIISPSTPLLSCPCCGAKPFLREGPNPTLFRAYWVKCPDCGLTTGLVDATAEAIGIWNRRQPAPPVPELEGHFALVLYFASQADADACAVMIQGAFENPVQVKLP